MIRIGITEQGDAALNNGWKSWVYEHNNPAILITKNPKKLIEENRELFFGDNLKGNVILHATITGLGGTCFEPNVQSSFDTLMFLTKCVSDSSFHKERLVIREDPIVPAFAIVDEAYRENLFNIAKFAVDNNTRYRTSFFDYYPHVRERFNELDNKVSPLIEKLNNIQPELHLPLETRLRFLEILKKNTSLTDEMIEICGEPGMKCTGCVSQKDLDIFGISLEDEIEQGFQRPACACLGLKKELLNNKHPCGHNCIYCYWKD